MPPAHLFLRRDALFVDIVRHPRDLCEDLKPCVAALGNFDGFHRGHQVVVGEAGRLARAMRLPLTVITTEPHPRRFFRPHDPPFRLTPFRERAWLLAHFGVDVLGSLIFDRGLASLAPQQFVLDYLVDGFAARHVVVGFDYRFGHGRAGGVDVLRWMGEMEGFGVSVIAPVTICDSAGREVVCSSSRVRDLLRQGAPRRAADILGHWWAVSGRVVHGDERGRELGYPTANMELGEALHPRHGIYAVRVAVEGEDAVRNAVASFGRRPTFGDGAPVLEVHLFDFEGDLYDHHLRVEFVDFLRAEERFDSIEALKAQMARDCDEARRRLADPANARARFLPPTLDDYLTENPAPRGVGAS